MINIVRKGIWPIPDEVKRCPVCNKYTEFYKLEDKYDVPPYYKGIQKYPTFTCGNCQTIWQYLGEKEEDSDNE